MCHKFIPLCSSMFPLPQPILIQTLNILHPDYCNKGGLFASGFSILSSFHANTRLTLLLGFITPNGPPKAKLFCLTFRAFLKCLQSLHHFISPSSGMPPSSCLSWPGAPFHLSMPSLSLQPQFKALHFQGNFLAAPVHRNLHIWQEL